MAGIWISKLCRQLLLIFTGRKDEARLQTQLKMSEEKWILFRHSSPSSRANNSDNAIKSEY